MLLSNIKIICKYIKITQLLKSLLSNLNVQKETSKVNSKQLSNITKEYMINIKSLLTNIYSIPSFQKKQ